MASKSASLPTFPRKELLVLELLAEHGPMFGLELVRVSRGHLKRGTVYVTLGRLADKSWVDSEQEPQHPAAIGLPRRVYRITSQGLRVLEAVALVRKTLAWGTR